MRRLDVAFVLMGLLSASACGGDDAGSPSSDTTTVPTVTTSDSTAATTTATTTTTPTTVTTTGTVPGRPGPTTPPDVTVALPPTTPAPTPATAFPELVTFGRPNPDLVAALPATDIPWDAVDGEWLTLDYPKTAYLAATQDLDRRGLYLVDPDGRIYAVAALPADTTRVIAVSAEGRRALLAEPYSAGSAYGLLDLTTTQYRRLSGAIANFEEHESVAFTRDGTGLWVYDIPWANPPEAGGSFRLWLVGVDDGSWTLVYEEPVELDDLVEYYDWWVNNRGGMVELETGEVVLATASGLWIGTPPSGFHAAGTLDTGCSIAGLWDDATLLVRCALPNTARCESGPTGLWLVPVATGVYSPLALPDVDSCVSYGGAVAVGDELAVNAWFGSGECNSHVLVIGPDGPEQWTPPLENVRCNESVIGHRNGAWLISAANPYVGSADFPLRLFEATSTDATPLDLPPGWFDPVQP